MVKLSELRDLSIAHEAGLSAENRALRDGEKAEALARLARETEKIVASLKGFDSSLASARAIDAMMAPSQAAIQALMNPAKPLLDFTDQWTKSPAFRAIGEMHESAQRIAAAIPRVDLSSVFDLPKYAGIDRLSSLTRELDLGRRDALKISPPVVMPPRRVRDRDQDERVEKITEVVVAQTKEIIELRAETRQVRESAARDAERSLEETQRRESKTVRITILLTVLSSILGAVATHWLSK